MMKMLFLSTVLFTSVTCIYCFGNSIILENDSLRVQIEENGCFSVLEKITGQQWDPDPWENSAAILSIIVNNRQHQVNLSKSQKIELIKDEDNTVTIRFIHPILASGNPVTGLTISVQLILDPVSAALTAKVLEIKESEKYNLHSLIFPARHFSLRTDIDRGAGVIPMLQGVICPSYIFPMTGGRFCTWDEAQHTGASHGMLDFYLFGNGLSMSWFGTYSDKSAVIGVLGKEPEARLEYIINNDGQYLFSREGEVSPWPRILTLSPVWNLRQKSADQSIQYNFIPHGDYVHMAKRYRKFAMERGHFVSLEGKAEKNPNVNKLAGAVYVGLFGGYPLYTNLPGMAFTFDQLKNIIQDIHENLNVENAFINAWGTFSNYPPNNWPISEKLGGAEKLKEAVTLAKEFGYLYSSYHAYSALLTKDPDFNPDLLPRDASGKSDMGDNRWVRVDSRHFKDLAQKNLPREIEAIGQNADFTDIAFIRPPDEGRIRLAKYLRSLNLVMATERGNEHYIPYFDLFEGMTYNYRSGPLSAFSVQAPLFNLVYHDAVANYGKIQDPDNDITTRGDFRVKSLQNILFGNGSMIFFAPYEYDGMREMISMANELVSPVHRQTFFAELTDHKYLSDDFKVQQSKFSNGVKVLVNLGPVEQTVPEGNAIPAYGFRIKDKNGNVKSGSFNLRLDID